MMATERNAPSNTLSVTLGIPTRNRGKLLYETLCSVTALDYPNLQIVVVDQSTNEETKTVVELFAREDPRIHYLPSDTVGSSAARNLAAAYSQADIIAYTDDDCIVENTWLDSLLAEFQNPRVAAVYGRLLPYEGGRTGREVGFKDSSHRKFFDRRTCPWYIGHGGNMAFRRERLIALGGFDPTLGAGDQFGACEDSDISYRLLAANQCVVYSPLAIALHKHWKQWNAQQSMERHYGVGAGAQFAKYIRCGDRYGWKLLATWIWELGVRRVGAGLFKWRDYKVVYLGYCQLFYPWIGILSSLGCRIDKEKALYVVPK